MQGDLINTSYYDYQHAMEHLDDIKTLVTMGLAINPDACLDGNRVALYMAQVMSHLDVAIYMLNHVTIDNPDQLPPS